MEPKIPAAFPPPFEESFDAAGLLMRLPREPEGIIGIACSVAMRRLEKYARAARRQHERVQEAQSRRERLVKVKDRRWTDELEQVLVDLHFHFTAWSQVGSMMRFVARHSGFAAAADVFTRHESLFEESRDARVALEHFDDRLPGGRGVDKMEITNDLGNVSPAEFSFGGRIWDVSNEALARREKAVKEFVDGIVGEGRARLRAIMAEDRRQSARKRGG